jgi:predicted transcriptional regulator
MARKSKLETYINILEILARERNFASQEPVDLTQIAHKTRMSRKVLKQRLDSLVQQNLVEEQKGFYTITERGLKVLYVVVPIMEEARKIPVSVQTSME